MYQVLYRKYRPRTFDDVVGQEHVTKTLVNELKSGRINHAYLFTGSRGTGKTTCAKILSKAVNCLNPQNSNPCNECEICEGIDSGEILDVIEMDAASNRKIDNIRSVIEEVVFTPAKAKYRVYIIDEVHMLTNEAFNALLKTLEEPPEHVIFILATTEVQKLPATITSRCQRFDFKRISPEDISKRLISIAIKENVSLTREASLMISVLADGALRDAISLLDRCIGVSSEIDINVVRNAAGLASKDHLFNICTSMINKNPAKVLEIIDDLYRNSKDMMRLTDELISHFRTLMLIKTVSDPRSMVVLSDKEFEVARSQADYLTLADIVYYMDVLQRAHERMGKGISNRIELETAVVKLASADLDSTNDALVVRISSLEKTLNSMQAEMNELKSQRGKIEYIERTSEHVREKKIEKDEPSGEQEVEFIEYVPDNSKKEEHRSFVGNEKKEIAEESQQVPLPAVPVDAAAARPVTESGKIDVEEISNKAQPFVKWPEVVENIKRYSTAISAAFKDCDAYVYDNFLLIDTKSDIPFKLLEKREQRDNIRNAVSEITGVKYRLGPYKPGSKNKEKKKDEVLQEFFAKLKESGISVSEVIDEG